MINDDYELTEVEEGILVLGVNLESEARQAVLEDLVDRLAADPFQLGTAVIALDEADADAGYWEVADEFTFATPSVHTKHARVIPERTEGCFGYLLRIESDDASNG